VYVKVNDPFPNPMTIDFTWPHPRNLVGALVGGVLLIAGAGCQTCSLSEADFQKQQRGQTVDRETGQAVAVVGTLGYYGWMIGELVASATRK
jgi:hypothetical protein